jgi:hypothetical protein
LILFLILGFEEESQAKRGEELGKTTCNSRFLKILSVIPAPYLLLHSKFLTLKQPYP